MSADLTYRQKEVLDYLYDYTVANGYPPTVREIGRAVGLASPSTVYQHLRNLEWAGFVVRREMRGTYAWFPHPTYLPPA